MAQAVAATKAKRKKAKCGQGILDHPNLPYPLVVPPDDLPAEDGEPLESDWHVMQIHLLLDLIAQLWAGRTD